MRQIKPNTQHPRKWALALRREMQMAVGLQLQVECEPPQELPPELTAITAATKNMIFTRTSSVRADKPQGRLQQPLCRQALSRLHVARSTDHSKKLCKQLSILRLRQWRKYIHLRHHLPHQFCVGRKPRE